MNMSGIVGDTGGEKKTVRKKSRDERYERWKRRKRAICG